MRRCCSRAPCPRCRCTCRFWVRLCWHCSRRVAVVAFDQHAAHAIGHLHHEHGGLHGTAGLVAQVQPHGFPGSSLGDAPTRRRKPWRHRARCAQVKGGGIAVSGLCQSAEQLRALLGIAGVQPARRRCIAACRPRVQGPAGAGQGGCVAAVGAFFCTVSEPDTSGRRWQVAKRLVARGNPAARGQVFPGRQCIGFGGVHGSGLRQFGAAGETGFGDAACQVQPPVSAMQPWSSRSTVSGASDSIRCR